MRIMWSFYFNIAKAQAFVFAYGVPHLCSSCKFLQYLRMNVLKYQQALRYLSASYNKFSQKDDENCEDTPYPLKPLRLTNTEPFFILFSLIYPFNILQSSFGKITIRILPLQFITACPEYTADVVMYRNSLTRMPVLAMVCIR